VGHIGKGILGTIEEGVGGTSSRSFYYGTGAAFFQAPSTQRSYGDDIRSFNVKTFGSRGMVNLPRRWFEMGPTELFFTYPINYAWAGPEYHLRIVPKDMVGGPRHLNGATYATTGVMPAGDLTGAALGDFLGECATEMRSGPNILPTYFWSGGVGFAFLSMIELNMGGGGNIIFDRYANFALTMASCPTIQMRRDLMRMAGGGLYYDHETDYSQLPVKFGFVPALTDEGTAYNRNITNSANTDEGENLNAVWAPLEWQISVPLKTPQTNFWHSLLSRKPIDSSCFASDLQYIIALANFYEFTDTGTGLAHCPYYIAPLGLACSPASIAADVTMAMPFYHPNQSNVGGLSTMAATGGNAPYTYVRNLADGWVTYTAPSATAAGYPIGTVNANGMGLYAGNPASGAANIWPQPTLLPPGYFYTGFSPQQDFNYGSVLTQPAGIATTPAQAPPVMSTLQGFYNVIANSSFNGAVIAYTVNAWSPKNRFASNPVIWANHYRVCNGFLYGGFGAPRPKMAVNGATAEADNRYMKDVFSVSNGGTNPIVYAQGFTRMEFRNRSLKLTNPSLSARLPLQSQPASCVYYPFTYAFSQTYRIAPSSNPFDSANFHRWCSNQALISNTSASGQAPITPFQDLLSISNRITQNIIMPANPVTSMIVGIYREKDRKYLGMNSQGTYSPALFWNALNPVRCTLYDGGNILFDYTGPVNHEFGSLVDRPDVFRIPFRGGLCQLDPLNILPSPFHTGTACTGSAESPNALNRMVYPWRWGKNAVGGGSQHGTRINPIHSTEWYNAHLLEFPFAMHEPLAREGTVQSTPSFAKTILRLEFYLDALLKPSRGLDDMYDQTTVVPSLWFSGEWNYLSYANGLPYNSSAGTYATPNYLPYGQLSFSNLPTNSSTVIYATANVCLSVPCAYILDSCQNFNSYSDDRENIVQGNRAQKLSNAYYTMSSSASSWNVNYGGLMIHVNFLQNQVWVISPLRTSILSSRG
jgi:hypothetical protein